MKNRKKGCGGQEQRLGRKGRGERYQAKMIYMVTNGEEGRRREEQKATGMWGLGVCKVVGEAPMRETGAGEEGLERRVACCEF